MDDDMVYFIIGYIVAGILTYGFEFGYWQREYLSLSNEDYSSDRTQAISFGLTGYLGILIVFYTKTYVHGMKFR